MAFYKVERTDASQAVEAGGDGEAQFTTAIVRASGTGIAKRLVAAEFAEFGATVKNLSATRIEDGRLDAAVLSAEIV